MLILLQPDRAVVSSGVDETVMLGCPSVVAVPHGERDGPGAHKCCRSGLCPPCVTVDKTLFDEAFP